MTVRPLIPVLLATAALAIVSLTGCSVGPLPGSPATAGAGSTEKPAATPTPQNPTPQKTQGTSKAPASGTGGCPSSNEVGSTLGIPTPPAPERSSLDGAVSCVYLSGSSSGVTIETIPSNGAAAEKLAQEFTAGTAFGLTFAPVTGIGDSAHSVSKGDSISGLYVIKGDTELSIAASGTTLTRLEDLAKKLLVL